LRKRELKTDQNSQTKLADLNEQRFILGELANVLEKVEEQVILIRSMSGYQS